MAYEIEQSNTDRPPGCPKGYRFLVGAFRSRRIAVAGFRRCILRRAMDVTADGKAKHDRRQTVVSGTLQKERAILRHGVNVHSSRDGMGLSGDRIRIDADLYEMKTDIGMLSMHHKCLEILPAWMVAKALSRISYIRTRHRTTTARVLPSRPGRTIVTIRL